MNNQKQIDNKNIKKVKRISMAFNEKEFLFIFNSTEAEIEDGEMFSIPIKDLAQITGGIIECGQEYQKEYQKDIGFGKLEI